jgi:hypothetical protein
MRQRDERDRLLRELERLREKAPAHEYAAASARILHQLQKLDRRERRYALT